MDVTRVRLRRHTGVLATGVALGLFSPVLLASAAPPPNDNCASSQTLTLGAPATFDTTEATSDGNATCGTSNGTPDVWFSFISTGGMVTVSTCDVASFDTVLSVLGACGGPELACNDDNCGSSTRSSLIVPTTAGTQYIIRIAGFAGATGTGSVLASLSTPCNFTPYPGAVPDGETCGADTNGGCNSPAPAYTIIPDGRVVSGTIRAQNGIRDTDWYSVVAPANGVLDVGLTASFQAVLLFLDIPEGNCQNLTVIDAASALPCTTAGMSVSGLSPGTTYYLFVSSGTRSEALFDGIPCPASYYLFADTHGLRQRILNELVAYNDQFYNFPGTGGPDGVRVVAQTLPGNFLSVFGTNVPASHTFGEVAHVNALGALQAPDPGPNPQRVPLAEICMPLSVIPGNVHTESLLARPVTSSLAAVGAAHIQANRDLDQLITQFSNPGALEAAIEQRLSVFNDMFYNMPGTGGPDGVRLVAMPDRTTNVAIFLTNVPEGDTFTRFMEVWHAGDGHSGEPGPNAMRLDRDALLAPLPAPPVDTGLQLFLVNGIDDDPSVCAPMVSVVQNIAAIIQPVPACPCDWNHSSNVNSQDFFDFLTAFFGGNADLNMDGFTNSQDYFDFLTCFFTLPPGC